MASFISTLKLSHLLQSIDSQQEMYVRIFGSNELAVGADPLQPTHIIDLSNEAVRTHRGPGGNGSYHQPAPTPMPMGPRTHRRSGEYWFEIRGHRTNSHSLKELLANGLRKLEEISPGTLDKLSHIKPRSRRIVARDPKDLFDREHLAKDYAERLVNGWWYGTNNSANETNAWLERATSCAGLSWGLDFKTSLTLTSDDLF